MTQVTRSAPPGGLEEYNPFTDARTVCWTNMLAVCGLVLSSTTSVPQNIPGINRTFGPMLFESPEHWQNLLVSDRRPTEMPPTLPPSPPRTRNLPSWSLQKSRQRTRSNRRRYFPSLPHFLPAFLQSRLCLPLMVRRRRNQVPSFMWCLSFPRLSQVLAWRSMSVV